MKRALSFILLAGLIFGIFVLVVMPVLADDATSGPSIAFLFSMWALTGLAAAFLRRGAEWLVDKVVLKRVDYAELAIALGRY